jgi:fido (protein-threonine AMPylation protein)
LVRNLPCPKWSNPEPIERLAGIASGAQAVFDFIKRQNPKGYILHQGNLKDWHKKLFAEAVPVAYYAGNFRSSDPRYPCLNVDVEVGPNRGVPFAEVSDQMMRFSAQMKEFTLRTDEYCALHQSLVERTKASAQIAAMAAGKIIQIHPFVNGNGRIARLTANFFLNRYGLKMPLYVDRPPGADYVQACALAMTGDVILLYRYLVALLAT